MLQTVGQNGYGEYVFDASARTIAISGIDGLTGAQILSVQNTTRGRPLYVPSGGGLNGDFADGVLTLQVNTTAMADDDTLVITVELPDTGGGGGASVSDTAYDATSWDGVTDVAPSKNAVRDKIESIEVGGGLPPYRASIGGSPNYTPDWTNGTYHSIYSDTNGADVVIFAPSNFEGGVANFGSELEICLEYADHGTINFDSGIQQSAGFGWEFPITIPSTGYRSYYAKLKFLANVWCLVAFAGDFGESTD